VRITLDTNILVTGHSSGASDGRQLLLGILRGGHRLVLSQSILHELEEVLHYPRIRGRYGLTDVQIGSYLAMLTEAAELVDLGPLIEIPLTDRDDWVVLRTSIDGNAEVLCTNDRGFYGARVLAFCAQYGLQVMRPRELLALLQST